MLRQDFVGGAALIVVAVLAPGMQNVLTTTDPGAAGWLLVGVMSMIPLGVAEAVRLATRFGK